MDMEKREPLCTPGETVNWYNHYEKQYEGLSKKLKIKPLHDPAILLGNTSKGNETLTIKNTCHLMFVAALFTIAKTWKQHECPSVDEWVKKLWYTMQ